MPEQSHKPATVRQNLIIKVRSLPCSEAKLLLSGLPLFLKEKSAFGEAERETRQRAGFYLRLFLERLIIRTETSIYQGEKEVNSRSRFWHSVINAPHKRSNAKIHYGVKYLPAGRLD